MDKKIAIHTMELWLADLPVVPGHVQHGTRPVVIVSNDIANNFSPIVTVVPLTTNRKASTLPTHVCLRGYVLSAIGCHSLLAVVPQIVLLPIPPSPFPPPWRIRDAQCHQPHVHNRCLHTRCSGQRHHFHYL